jgi:hypothetical protein
VIYGTSHLLRKNAVVGAVDEAAGGLVAHWRKQRVAKFLRSIPKVVGTCAVFNRHRIMARPEPGAASRNHDWSHKLHRVPTTAPREHGRPV